MYWMCPSFSRGLVEWKTRHMFQDLMINKAYSSTVFFFFGGGSAKTFIVQHDIVVSCWHLQYWKEFQKCWKNVCAFGKKRSFTYSAPLRDEVWELQALMNYHFFKNCQHFIQLKSTALGNHMLILTSNSKSKAGKLSNIFGKWEPLKRGR